MIQLFQKYANTLNFRQAFRRKRKRLKIALQVSKLGFSPIVMPWGERGEIATQTTFLLTTAIPLPIKLYVALRVGVAVILSQRPTPGTIEYSTNRFCGETLVLAGVLKSQVFKLCFGAKSFVPGKKIGKVTKRRRLAKPTCANGGTNRANGGTKASFCTSGDFQFFLARCQVCFEFDSATVKREKKERTKEKKDCGQRQRQNIS